MNTIDYIKDVFEHSNVADKRTNLDKVRFEAFNTFRKLNIPTAKHEEWKYTRVGGLFTTKYSFPLKSEESVINTKDVDVARLPGYEAANELVFVNGFFSSHLSTIRSSALVVLPLEKAAENEYKEIVTQHLGHSASYLKDGINALNTAFIDGGLFIYVKKGQVVEHPVYIYNITDSRSANILAQPRSLVYVSENAKVQFAETYVTLGKSESFINQVMEVIVEKDAWVEYYKIQNDATHANQVSTTHIRQIGKSFTHTVTISLNGGMLRNNLNIVMEAPYCEAHLYGLYFQKGQSHVDNHTVVDNKAPNCFSNELYKGMLDDNATGVFNGKIFVNQLAQKTNAYQSNKNILLSGSASVNTKPQLEIFADDVKCSHGCTIGRLDDEGLFYLQSRGIPEKIAQSLLLHGFAIDVLDKIQLEPIRKYVDQLIDHRLELVQ
jgi:Fe-S cluster assembly protein SufD